VSDDEESENDDESVSESEHSNLEELEEEFDEETTSESDDDDQSFDQIKVIKLNISDDVEEDTKSYDDANQMEFELDDDLALLEDVDDIPQISEEYVGEVLNLTYDEVKEGESKEEDKEEGKEDKEEAVVVPSTSELKTISINLGDDSHSEHVDYKKLPLPKLRSIAVEKSLTNNSDAQKLKKPEILKLLGVE